MKNQIILLITFLTVFTLSSYAQAPYRAAIGARLGTPLSASIKYFATESVALEAYVGTRGYTNYRWNNLSAAVQVHRSLNLDAELEGLSYYLGAGASMYFWNYDDIFGFSSYSTSTFGIQCYAGLDYAFNDLPINLSLDWTPTYFIGNGFFSGFGAGYGTLGLRYILGR